MSTIDIDTARRIARLARIRIADPDLPDLATQLSGMVTFMEQLATVDVTGVEPMTAVMPMPLYRRPDVVDDGDCAAELLRNAPDAREGFFAVPKVME